MHKKKPSANGNNLSATVDECLPTLEALALSLQIYGNEDDGAKLRSVIDQLRSASPDTRPAVKVSLDFVVNGTFKVSASRSQILCGMHSLEQFRGSELLIRLCRANSGFAQSIKRILGLWIIH